jgi:SAM-dependent methyltransferase
LISVKKTANGSDEIHTIFQDGTDVSSVAQIPEYKTLILRVGFDETHPKHAFVNPAQDAIDDKIPVYDNEKERYMPMQFYPTEPDDAQAGLCYILIGDTDKNILTEQNEIIEDNMIVEFRYDLMKTGLWRWIPVRVRYDKTAQLRAGEKNFGNAYHVANSNWHSIHNPITEYMIMTGENIPTKLADDEVYYNTTTGASKTQGLRDFHNLFVKKQLINSVAKPGMTLIDLAVGKAGDFPKWIDAKLKFVFGVDISPDNIRNRINGAYSRYLKNRINFRVMPDALFVVGDSGVNIRKTTGILGDKDKQITHAVFGMGPKDVTKLGKNVYKQYAIAKEGFDVCSIQFAIHYMFKNQETLQNFLQNVSEVTKEGGYFIGTSYDGEEIFKMLKNVKENESKLIRVEDKKIWEVTKRYDRDEFNADETCVGYAIDVYQETINKTFREYLVNYTYLTRVLENYGFVPATREDLAKLNAPFTNGTGMFEELFIKMNEEVKKNSRTYKEAPNMSVEEKTISFLNRYFIYKKVRKVSDVEQIASNLQHKTVEEIEEASPPPPTDVAAATATSAAATAATATASAAAAPTTKTKTKTATAKTATAKTATAKTATVKAKTTKKNQPILSVITEESEPAMPVPVPMSSAMPVPVPAMPVPAMPVPEVAPALEKKTVRKYTRKLKI